MNICGRPIAQMLRTTAVHPARLIAIHDSLDHKPCAVSPKFGGSANGHNGVRSVVAALGNCADFHRIRLGIGRGPDITNYVLGPMPLDQQDFWSASGPGSELVWKQLKSIIEKNIIQ